jgi:hypothetical protein
VQPFYPAELPASNLWCSAFADRTFAGTETAQSGTIAGLNDPSRASPTVTSNIAATARRRPVPESNAEQLRDIAQKLLQAEISEMKLLSFEWPDPDYHGRES